jgi:hypothetical protein
MNSDLSSAARARQAAPPDDGKADRIIGRIAQEIECVGLKRAAVRRCARDHFDQKHRRIDDQRDPKDAPPARIGLGRFAPAGAFAATGPSRSNPSRQIPSRTAIYTL